MNFVKNHTSSSTKIRSRRIVNVKGRFVSFETCEQFFSILVLGWRVVFITYFTLVVNQRVVCPFPTTGHCLSVYFWGNHKRRLYCYPVLISSCDIQKNFLEILALSEQSIASVVIVQKKKSSLKNFFSKCEQI